MENASTQKFKKERAAHYNEFEAMQVRGNARALRGILPFFPSENRGLGAGVQTEACGWRA